MTSILSYFANTNHYQFIVCKDFQEYKVEVTTVCVLFKIVYHYTLNQNPKALKISILYQPQAWVMSKLYPFCSGSGLSGVLEKLFPLLFTNFYHILAICKSLFRGLKHSWPIISVTELECLDGWVPRYQNIRKGYQVCTQ